MYTSPHFNGYSEYCTVIWCFHMIVVACTYHKIVSLSLLETEIVKLVIIRLFNKTPLDSERLVSFISKTSYNSITIVLFIHTFTRTHTYTHAYMAPLIVLEQKGKLKK